MTQPKHHRAGSNSRGVPECPCKRSGRWLSAPHESATPSAILRSWSLESLQGVVDAAEESRSPVIIGFNGAFLCGDRRAGERLALYAAVGRAAAESSTVPCGLIFNECPRDEWVKSAVEAGFNLVMLADPAAEPAELTARVAAITRFAHALDVAVEGEVGELPCGATAGAQPAHGGSRTDPALAADFVTATGVDLLAVSVGNVHIKTSGEEGLDLALLEQIRKCVPVPLVLHGGTGISPMVQLREAIALGVAKVNFGTYLKRVPLSRLRARRRSRGKTVPTRIGFSGWAGAKMF